MKQNRTTVKLSGAEGFEAYYKQVYEERWDNLKQSLFQPGIHVTLAPGGTENYFLDPGSVCAAMCLPLGDDAKKNLDMCAAPGGKTLVISSLMNEDAELFSNERSPDRKARLAKVVQTCLPESISTRIKVSCSDTATWCKRENSCYDRILLDAPCSSERHVLLDPKYLNEWSPSRIKTLAMEQWALLSSGWRLLKQNGYLLYATCALAPQENDGTLSRLQKKFDDVEFVPYEKISEIFSLNNDKLKSLITGEDNTQKKIDLKSVFEKADKTEYGYHILPDKADGAGPLFFSLMYKK